MLGSILSNCLLVLGGCFFAGGIRFHEQGYSLRAAQLNINLLGALLPVESDREQAVDLPFSAQVSPSSRLSSLSRSIRSSRRMGPNRTK